ncbi:MAG TPA: substrate-binding domain-containing protein [Anaeromyxobacter sp.]|nr:substrate-binding domain-containing protein [Anaeromyxobacter sp.]
MRTPLLVAAALAVAACGEQEAIKQLAQCQRELGGADAHLAAAQAAQAAAERKAQALEEELRGARDELAAAKTHPGPAATAEGEQPSSAPAGAVASPAPPDKGSKRLKIGVSLPTREERWVKDKLTMLAEAKKRNIDLLVQLSEDDPAKQQAQCEAMIAQGIKVLIIAPNDASAAAAIVDRAQKAGVAVISYDRLILDSPHDYYYLSFDGVKVGELQGEWLTKKVSKGNFIILSGAPTDNNAKLFKQGAMRYLQPLIDKGEVKPVLDSPVKDWNPPEAKALCQKALASAKNNVQAVLAPNDGTAGGCIEALLEKGLAGKVPVTGQDADVAAAVRIVKGEQGMTVFKDTRLLGRAALEMAETLARGKPYDTGGRTISNNRRQVRAVLLTPYAVTRENLDERLIRSGYLTHEAVYRR